MDSRALAAAGGALIGGLVVAALLPAKPSSRIQRIRTEDPRSSAIVVHNGVVMISGQVRGREREREREMVNCRDILSLLSAQSVFDLGYADGVDQASMP